MTRLPSRRRTGVRRLFFLCALSLFALCVGSVVALPAGADLVLLNGTIYTGQAGQPRAEAMAIQSERIVAVGSSNEIRALVGPNTRVVD